MWTTTSEFFSTPDTHAHTTRTHKHNHGGKILSLACTSRSDHKRYGIPSHVLTHWRRRVSPRSAGTFAPAILPIESMEAGMAHLAHLLHCFELLANQQKAEINLLLPSLPARIRLLQRRLKQLHWKETQFAMPTKT